MPVTYEDLEREWNHTTETASGLFSFQILENNLSLRQRLYLNLTHIKKLTDAQNRIKAFQRNHPELEQSPFYKTILNISKKNCSLDPIDLKKDPRVMFLERRITELDYQRYLGKKLNK